MPFTFPYAFIFIEIIKTTGQMIAFKISKMGACITIIAVLDQWQSAWLLTTWSWVRSPQTAWVIRVLKLKMNHEVPTFGKTFWKTNVEAMEVVFEVLVLRPPCSTRVGRVWKD